jgi:hypothetical protein
LKKIVKKAFTILLLALFLLNVVGFYGIFLGLKFTNTQVSIKALDEESYQAGEELTFAVPLTVPYYTNPSAAYERVDGEFEHNGEVYRLVKQKLQRDTLFVVCIKDQKSKTINAAIEDLVKTFTDQPINAKEHAGKSLQSISKDYFSSRVNLEPGVSGWKKTMTFSDPQDLYSHQSLFEIYSPPRAVSFL